MSIDFDFLPAGSGDCILVQTHDYAMLIDSGDEFCHEEINAYLALALKNKKINLIILTHIDDDHIGGMRKLLLNNSFLHLLSKTCELWINYPTERAILFPLENYDSLISYRGGDLIKKLISERKIRHINNIYTQENFNLKYLTKELSITLLSPKKNNLDKLCNEWNNNSLDIISNTLLSSSDYHKTLKELELEKDKNNYSVPNGSSIAFILNYKTNNKFLFLADAYPQVITNSLINLGYSKDRPLNVDFIKISHHGSKFNNTRELFNLLSSNNFIFLTNSKDILPHKKTLSRIIHRKKSNTIIDNFIFNYSQPIEKLKKDNCLRELKINYLLTNKLTYRD